MEVSYSIDYDKHFRTQQYYLKHSPDANKRIQDVTLVILWILCFFLTIPFSILSVKKGFCLSASVYFIVILLFMIFSKSLSRRLMLKSVKKGLKEYENDSVSIIQREDSISFKNKNGLTQHYWRSINDIERGEQFLLFNTRSTPHLIPRYAFQTQDDFESFYRTSREYQQAHDDKQKRSSKSVKMLYLLPILMCFLAFSTFSSTPASEPEYVHKTETFWRNVYGSELPEVEYTFNTTDDFQNMMTEEQWKKNVQALKEQYGGIHSIYPIAYAELNKEVPRAVVLCRVLGDRKFYYIRTYLLQYPIGWEMNGYDLIVPLNVDLEEKTFSLQKDRDLLKEKLPYKIHIMDNSALELSGYQGD